MPPPPFFAGPYWLENVGRSSRAYVSGATSIAFEKLGCAIAQW